jgi:hypothetical protein
VRGCGETQAFRSGIRSGTRSGTPVGFSQIFFFPFFYICLSVSISIPNMLEKIGKFFQSSDKNKNKVYILADKDKII